MSLVTNITKDMADGMIWHCTPKVLFTIVKNKPAVTQQHKSSERNLASERLVLYKLTTPRPFPRFREERSKRSTCRVGCT